MDNERRGAAAGRRGNFALRSQYIKDLSFENPGGPGAASGPPPRVNFSFAVNGRETGAADMHEVELKLEVRAARGDDVAFILELTYAGIFRVKAASDSARRALVLVECPRLLFPFARRIVADCTRDGGFPPLLLEPIDFGALFRRSSEGAQRNGDDAPSARVLH